MSEKVIDDVPPVTRQLAAFVAGSRWQDLPPEVRHGALAAAVNGVANMVGGAWDPCMDRFLAALDPFMGPRKARLPGRRQMVDVPAAAFLNAVSANVLDFDDTHLPSLVHPGATVLAPLLALAEEQPVTGQDLLHALALGMEVACRLGMALHPGHYEHGWHITTTCGVIGAAAGAARLLGLDAQQTAHALGIAANSAGGLIENLSSMAKSVGVGNASRNGLLAACMARAGVDAAPAALEGRFGLLQVTCDAPRFEAAAGGLGTRWEMLQRFAKPYPSCALSFPVIDGALELRARPGFMVANVERVLVRGNPLMLVRAGRASVRTGREAKLSVRHSVAIALLHGSAGVQDYLDATVNDPATVQLSARVDCEGDAALPAESALLRMQMKDGRVEEVHVRQGRGTPERPLSDAELNDKALGLLAFGAPSLPAEEVLAALWSLPACPDVRRLLALACPPAHADDRNSTDACAHGDAAARAAVHA
jgi:2-methylcitrate dehydratase PrpD